MLTTLLVSVAASAAEFPADPVDAPWTFTPLGVEVQDVTLGTGEVAVEGAGVSVHYRGLLADGTEFDQSMARGRPLSIRIGSHEVIAGWEDGLVGMRVGGKRRMVIPPHLGYADRQMGPIPANSTLYFEVELMSVTPPRQAPSTLEVVGDASWRIVPGGKVADLVVGPGRHAGKKSRVCLDYALFREGAVAEHTYTRRACTWYPFGDDDLPEVFWQGVEGMREAGTRLATGADGATYRIELEAIHK